MCVGLFSTSFTAISTVRCVIRAHLCPQCRGALFRASYRLKLIVNGYTKLGKGGGACNQCKCVSLTVCQLLARHLADRAGCMARSLFCGA